MSVVSFDRDVGPCRKRLHIEVPAAGGGRRDRARRARVRQQGAPPGFPHRARCRRRWSSSGSSHEIEREVLDRLVPRYWKQAQAESQLDPLLPPQRRATSSSRAASRCASSRRSRCGRRSSCATSRTSTCRRPTPSRPRRGSTSAPRATCSAASPSGSTSRVRWRAATGSRSRRRSSSRRGRAGGRSRRRSRSKSATPQVWEELSLALTGLEAGQETEFDAERPAPPEPRCEGDGRRGAAASGVKVRRSCASATCRRSTTRWRRGSANFADVADAWITE